MSLPNNFNHQIFWWLHVQQSTPENWDTTEFLSTIFTELLHTTEFLYTPENVYTTEFTSTTEFMSTEFVIKFMDIPYKT